jgi:hypothetical protein
MQDESTGDQLQNTSVTTLAHNGKIGNICSATAFGTPVTFRKFEQFRSGFCEKKYLRNSGVGRL